jgi:hypothetical protein
MCEELLPHVVGRAKWKKDIATKRVSDIATPSDIAFILLVLENNWDYWVQYATSNSSKKNNDQAKVQETLKCPKTKWTSGNLLFGQNSGWTKEGILRFNELCQLEKANREAHKMVEEEFLNMKMAESNRLKHKKRRTQAESVQVYMDMNDELSKFMTALPEPIGADEQADQGSQRIVQL